MTRPSPLDPNEIPWTADEWTVVSTNGGIVAIVNPDDTFDPKRDEECANTLAAAPDLLTAVDTALAWLWDPDADPVEQYERIAEEFRRDTGYLRPGKSEPAEMASEERDRKRREAFTAWSAARSRVVLRLMRAAVAKARGGVQ